MLDSNYRNSSCGFGEDLVAYLYDEIGTIEKSKFESHLAHCKNCEEEITSFGNVRNSILQWREDDFSHLSLPKIEICFDQNTKTISNISIKSKTWCDKFRETLSASQNWATASVSFAVLVIFTIVTIFAFNYFKPNEVVENKVTNNEKQPKIEEKVVKPEENDLAEKTSIETKVFNDSKPDVNNKSESLKKTPSIRKLPKQVGKSKRQTVIKKETKEPNNTDQKQDIKRPNDEIIANYNEEQVPKLSNFTEETENEDVTISLADLFDEVGDDR